MSAECMSAIAKPVAMTPIWLRSTLTSPSLGTANSSRRFTSALASPAPPEWLRSLQSRLTWISCHTPISSSTKVRTSSRTSTVVELDLFALRMRRVTRTQSPSS